MNCVSGWFVGGICRSEQESSSQCSIHHEVKSVWRAVGIGNCLRAELFWIKKSPRAKGALWERACVPSESAGESKEKECAGK